MKKVTMKKLLMFVIATLVSSLTLASPVWIDVRSAQEYAQDHISGDKQIPYEHIVPEVEKLFPDKDTEIHLYCRSGRRAGIAMSKLKAAGYHNVSNAGGIGDARKSRALVQESCSPKC